MKMKIRTIRPFSGCAGYLTPEGIKIGGCSIETTGMNRHELKEKAACEENSCLHQQVKLDEWVFIKVSSYDTDHNRVSIPFVAQVVPHAETGCLGLTGLVRWGSVDGQIALDSPVWVESFFPTPDFSSVGPGCMFTSDGAIFPDDGNFLGAKDGSIEEFTPKELLAALSKEESLQSATYSMLRFKPVKRRPRSPKRGTVIFNDNLDILEYYSGTEWRKL
jgi:hypothetical protein